MEYRKSNQSIKCRKVQESELKFVVPFETTTTTTTIATVNEQQQVHLIIYKERR